MDEGGLTTTAACLVATLALTLLAVGASAQGPAPP